MLGFDRILCPTDGSIFSDRALRYAVAMAGWYRATATALYVHRSPIAPALWAEYPIVFPDESAAALAEQTICAGVRAVAGDSVPVVFRRGVVVEEILQAAREMPADLIVMGTHGAGGLEHLMLGSVTENVLRNARCPVLTIPRAVASSDPAALHPRFTSILCPIDFSPDSVRALDYALSLAQESNGRLLLIHALEHFEAHDPRTTAHYNVPEFRRSLVAETRRRLDALVPPATREWCDSESIVACGRPFREVLRVADEHRADLIVLGVHHRNAMDLALFGSTTAKLLRQASCPVLTVPRDVKPRIAAA